MPTLSVIFELVETYVLNVERELCYDGRSESSVWYWRRWHDRFYSRVSRWNTACDGKLIFGVKLKMVERKDGVLTLFSNAISTTITMSLCRGVVVKSHSTPDIRSYAYAA